MSELRAAAERALEALDRIERESADYFVGSTRREAFDAADDLRAALAAELPQPVAKTVATAPPRIWLQVSDDASDVDEPWPEDAWPDATWCWHSTTDAEVEYVRADLVAPPPSAPQSEAQPVAVVTECEACFTPDVCQLRGKCDHYSTDWLRVAPPPPAAAPTDAMVEAARQTSALAPSDAEVEAALRSLSFDKSWTTKMRRALRAAAAARKA